MAQRKPTTPEWSRNAWLLLSGLALLAFVLGITVVGRFEPDSPRLGTWAAFCRSLGFTADRGAATEPQPTPRTPTTVAWTRETLAEVAAGDPSRGIAPCAVCHGPSGYKVGSPALLRQRTAYIERQTAAFAQGKRQNDIDEQMRTVAAQLTAQEMHAVAVFYGGYRAPDTVP